MLRQSLRTEKEIAEFLNNVIKNQSAYEQALNVQARKKNGIFLTNSLEAISNVLSIVDIENGIFNKKILEPACGQGIFILKLLINLYLSYPDEDLISNFISQNIYFIDIQKDMVEKTKSNIKECYYFLFKKDFKGKLNGIVADFTDKQSENELPLFGEEGRDTFNHLYSFFDYVIGNPPYVTLYGRRDKKENENQRIRYLHNYKQFPSSVKNGKINLVMLFLEHSLDFLKENGKLSFIVDVSFFETAYQYIRKYLLENTRLDEIQLNVSAFDVASGQVILKLTKVFSKDNTVRIIDNKTKSSYLVPQQNWYNQEDEYKFRYNGCQVFKQILEKVKERNDSTLLQLFPNKNLRTCVMLLDMEDKFTFERKDYLDMGLVYPYYQGSKSLSEKFGKLSFSKFFYYDKPLQDSINSVLKTELEKQGIKNKKRIGLGETIVYDNPKIYIRQSAKEIVASLDFGRSAANNSLYVFSLRDNSQKTIDFLYFMCGFLNSDFITYYAQQMNIIRYAQGKQPQIKIKDLGSVFIPQDIFIQKNISDWCKLIYKNEENKEKCISEINKLIYTYYDFNETQIKNIEANIRSF